MGKTFVDRTGIRYGRLIATNFLGKPEGKTKAVWECLCDCGELTTVTSSNLATGHTLSCGCLLVETSAAKRIYRKEDSAEYVIWRSIRQRTGSHAGKNHKWYTGVTMSRAWQESFETFLADIGKRPSSLHSIERKEGSKGYSADNCIWATAEEQANNRSTNVLLEHLGETLTIAQWAKRTGIKQATLAARIRRGWAVDQAITADLNTRNSNGTK